MVSYNEPPISNRLIISLCLYSSIFLFFLISLLFFSEFYLQIGNINFAPFLLLFILAEIVKFIYFRVALLQPNSGNGGAKKWSKPKSSFTDSLAFQVISQVKLKKVFKSLIVLSTAIIVFFCTAILFGAPFLSKHEETLMFSSLVAVQTILPISLHQGPNNVLAFLMTANPNNAIEQVLLRNFYFVLIGSWLGAFVIPLDWDRPWQVWPISCSSAALMSHFVAHAVTCLQYCNNFFYKKATNKFGKRLC